MKNERKAFLTLALVASMMCSAEVLSCRLTFYGYGGKETLKDGCKIDRKMLELLRAK